MTRRLNQLKQSYSLAVLMMTWRLQHDGISPLSSRLVSRLVLPLVSRLGLSAPLWYLDELIMTSFGQNVTSFGQNYDEFRPKLWRDELTTWNSLTITRWSEANLDLMIKIEQSYSLSAGAPSHLSARLPAHLVSARAPSRLALHLVSRPSRLAAKVGDELTTDIELTTDGDQRLASLCSRRFS